jgi:ribonucleoside-triphosphate reductase
MIKRIVKRDGGSQRFVPFKIEDAIKKAFESEVVPYDKAVLLM